MKHPRVEIEYHPPAARGHVIRLPFVIGVLADLSGSGDKSAGSATEAPLANPEFIDVTEDTLDKLMEAIRPRLTLEVVDTLTDSGSFLIDLEFQSLDDFRPHCVASQCSPLRQLLDVREYLSRLQLEAEACSDAVEGVARLLDQSASFRKLVSKQTGEVRLMAAKPHKIVQEHLQILDEALSKQLGQIIYHEDFLALEATWLGLNFLRLQLN